MKMRADRKRTDIQFSVGDHVLLKLKPYTHSSVAIHHHPKLSYKYFGHYKVLERIGVVAHRLELRPGSQMHSVLHVSQFKSFQVDYIPVHSHLPVTTDFQPSVAIPDKILERRLIKKGNNAVPQIRVNWTGLPPSVTSGRITMS